MKGDSELLVITSVIAATLKDIVAARFMREVSVVNQDASAARKEILLDRPDVLKYPGL